MKTKLTRIHIGLGIPEIGVQFETLDDADQKASTQRAFVAVAPEMLAPVWVAAQAALTAALDELPLDFPPTAVTTALMQKREALAEAAQATQQKVAAEAEAQAAAQAKALAEQATQAAEAEKAALDVQIAAKRAELEALAATTAVVEATPTP